MLILGKQPRVFLDCTHTYKRDHKAGIQRVVRNLTSFCKGMEEELGVLCRPVVWDSGYFYYLNRSFDDNPKQGDAVRLRPPKPVDFKKGDVLVLIDSSWEIPFWGSITEVRKLGVKVGFVLYDLVPIRTPQYHDPTTVEKYTEWLEKFVKLDFCLTISETTRRDLELYLKEQGEKRTLRSLSFRLGVGLDRFKESTAVRRELRDLFSSDQPQPYLIVGTLEPRKNHKFLLGVFDLLWRRGMDVRLCIIGKIGWLTEDLVREIKKHPQWGRMLFMFNDLSDTELSFCYENAKALVTPSLYEGFNLPIIEALSKKLPVLASDIPIHHETCGEYCVYFGLESPQSLVKLIIDFEKKGRPSSVKSPDDFRWPGWKESTEDLIEKVKRLAWQ